MRNLRQASWLAVLLVLFACGAANAQTSTAPVAAQNDTTPSATSPEVNQSPTNLIDAANQYKASSTELLAMQEESITKAEAKLVELRALVSQGLIARAELEEAEQQLAELRTALQTTQQQIAGSDNMIAEIKAEQERSKAATPKLVKLVSKQYGAFSTTATILRYNGVAAWSLGSLNQVQSFFSAKFGRALPTSAVGQSATHNRLGYDHRNAVDVALNPGSSEGLALINYLQSQGIPFLAFRSAVPGVATGPHIHIGSPSHRLS